MSLAKKKTSIKPKTQSAPQYHDGQEYVVCLVKGVDYDSVWSALETETYGLATIPNRAARILNDRKASPRSCHYSLTKAEADQIRRDPRVHSVEVPPQYNPRLVPRHKAVQTANFNKSENTPNSNYVNWGLCRVNSPTNNYGYTFSPTSETYAYVLDGTGVDVVVQDSGLQIDHPEFAGRVQPIDWYTASGVVSYNNIASIGIPGSPNYLEITPGPVASNYVADRNSLYFNGHDWLGLAYSVSLGSGDFSAEMFFKIDSDVDLNTTQMAFFGPNGYDGFGVYTGTGVGGPTSTDITVDLYGTAHASFHFPTITVGVWHHLAVTRQSGYMNIYLDGAQPLSYNQANTYDFSGGLGSIGNWGGVYSFKGHITNVRVSNGTALYAAGVGRITVPTAPLSNASSVVLLINCLDSSTPFLDTSSSPIPLENGHNDSTSVVTFSSGTGAPEFTVEFWFYLITDPASHRHAFIGSNNSGGLSIYTGQEANYGSGNSNHAISVDWYGTGGTQFNFTATITTETWYHCALVRDSSFNQQMFLNGIASTSTTYGPNNTVNPNGHIIEIGHWDYGNFYLNGAITDIRVVQGHNVYDATTSTITVPTQMLTAVTGTQFLMNVTYYTAYTGPIDATGLNTISNPDNATIELGDGPVGVLYQNFQPPEHYMDTVGHGTHCTGIAAGKTFGWAKGADVYSLKIAGLEGPDDPGTGIFFPDSFDVITQWHLNKPLDPVTQTKRPTIVNMSWGYEGSYGYNTTSYIVGGNYRGTAWTGSTLQTQYGMIINNDPAIDSAYPARDPSTDVALEEMIDAGITVCIASGNDGYKIDLPSGPDYNNWWTDGTYQNFYQQGSSPYSLRANMVGAIDSEPYSTSTEQRVFFSNGGPGVDFYSPGVGIASATSNDPAGLISDGYAVGNYFLNPAYKQAMVDGTSQATPQVTGLGALFLQMNPTATPAQVKQWFLDNAQSTLYSTGVNNDYTNTNSVWGGNPIMIFNPINTSTVAVIGG